MGESEKADKGIEAVLDEMRQSGINGAVVRKDGVKVHSTIALNDVGAKMLASVANVSDALMKKSGDKQKSIDIVFGELIYVLIPVGNHLFIGTIKDRENKKTVLEFAKKAEKFL
ncbi:TPA: hypothetical protein EYP38_02820 [Candidatus Micrarchaeota archaeon]|nr:hypothetical protein [Candidatus Micrarchaeota archaeon]